MHAFSMIERVGTKEKPMVLAFIDSDGGSVLIQRDRQERLLSGATGSEIDPKMVGWETDSLYEEDIKYFMGPDPSTPYAGHGIPNVSALIRANRFREQRMVARIAQLLLTSGTTERSS